MPRSFLNISCTLGMLCRASIASTAPKYWSSEVVLDSVATLIVQLTVASHCLVKRVIFLDGSILSGLGWMTAGRSSRFWKVVWFEERTRQETWSSTSSLPHWKFGTNPCDLDNLFVYSESLFGHSWHKLSRHLLCRRQERELYWDFGRVNRCIIYRWRWLLKQE